MWLLSELCLRLVSFPFKFKVLCTYSVFILSARFFFFHDPLIGCWSESLGRKHPGVGLHFISLSRTDTRAQTRADTRVPAALRGESRGTRAIAATQAERGGAKLGLFWPWGLWSERASAQSAVGYYCAWGKQFLLSWNVATYPDPQN